MLGVDNYIVESDNISKLTKAIKDVLFDETEHLRHDLRTPLQCKVFLSGLTAIQPSGLETWNPLKTNSEKKIER